MTQLDPAIIGALLCGLIAWFVVVPLASKVPFRLEVQWEHEFAVRALSEVKPIDATAYALTSLQKTAVVGAAVALGYLSTKTYGIAAAGMAMGLFFQALLLLAVINLKHALLPDSIALPVLWVGLLYGATQGTGAEHIYGAAVGYMAPFSVNLIIRASSRRDLIGHGDMKTLSMAGAWFGVSAMPTLLLLFTGMLFATIPLFTYARRKFPHGLPTGPAHLVASVAVAMGAHIF